MTVGSKKCMAISINGFLIALMIILALYVKFGTLLEPESWRRSENVVRLFQDCFSPEQPLNSSLNNISLFLWSSVISICWLTVAFLKRLNIYTEINRYLVAYTVFMSVIVVDELFRFTIMLNLFLDVPKAVVYLLYGFVFIGFISIFRKQIYTTPYVYLLIGFLFLIISNGVELMSLEGQTLPIFLEDSIKFLGIVNIGLYSWFTYFQCLTALYGDSSLAH